VGARMARMRGRRSSRRGNTSAGDD